jgi:hypothetical protein
MIAASMGDAGLEVSLRCCGRFRIAGQVYVRMVEAAAACDNQYDIKVQKKHWRVVR